MAAPVVSSITPNEGFSVGDVFVSIVGTGFNDESSGGTVEVFFGGVAAIDVGVVDSTRVICRTPRSLDDVLPSVVDVVVENVPEIGAPEPTTVVGGFTYRRPSLATDVPGENSPLGPVTESLIRDLRRYVLAESHHDMHQQYVDPLDTTQEKQARQTNLKLVGPSVAEDREHASANGFQNLQTSPAPGNFDVLQNPVTVMLTYQYVGVGKTKGEAFNLWTALTRYFQRTPRLSVFRNAVDDTDGIADFEMFPSWAERATFGSVANRHGVWQFTGSVVIRGVHVLAEKRYEGADVETTIVEYVLKP